MKLKSLLLPLFSFEMIFTALGAPFSYQGLLSEDDKPANGTFDLRFSLFKAPDGGLAPADPITLEDVAVEDGILSTLLDFGEGVFDGTAVYLQIEVRAGDGDGDYITLRPRQRIGAVPYAQFAIEGNRGQKGETGEQGARGNQGPSGPSGPEGAKGDKGDVGAGGPAGAAGSQGPQGLKGDKGDMGATGATGTDGSQGPQGPQGKPGSTDAWSRTGTEAVDGEFIGTTNKQPLEIRTGNVMRMKIDTAGNIGIGEGRPRTPLHVGGTLRVDGSGAGAVLLDLHTDRDWQFRQRGSGALANLELASVGGGGARDFVITTKGNLGINTATPLQKLDVAGAIRIANTTGAPQAGTIRWNGTDFEGYTGASWVSLVNPPASGTTGATIEFVEVGNPGNAAKFFGEFAFGEVARTFWIGKYEITNAQYVEFLNAVAETDPNALYTTGMGSFNNGGIARSGEPGSYAYHARKAMGDKPVNYVSFWDACRFCNWLHNRRASGAQSDATTEDGAYTLTASAIDENSVTRNDGARFFIPSDAEWFKAAYYDPSKPGGAGYWVYPTQSDSFPAVASVDAVGNIDNDTLNIANYDRGSVWNGEVSGNVTTVGSGGAGSAGFYGAYDMGGNVGEWNDKLSANIAASRGQRGGSWLTSAAASNTLRSAVSSSTSASQETGRAGFRVAHP